MVTEVILISMYVTKVSYRFLGGEGWGKGVLRASTDLGPNYITDTLGPPPFLCHIQLCLCSYTIILISWGGVQAAWCASPIPAYETLLTH